MHPGGGRGIGRGHCFHLATNGASVIVNDVDLEEARNVAAEIEDEGGKASASSDDIGTREGARALIAQCVDTVDEAIDTPDFFMPSSDAAFMQTVRVPLGRFPREVLEATGYAYEEIVTARASDPYRVRIRVKPTDVAYFIHIPGPDRRDNESHSRVHRSNVVRNRGRGR